MNPAAGSRRRAALALTVLGSGSPFTSSTRASSGYVVWVEGVARLLVEAGGGTFERLGRAGIDPAGLDAVLLTHTHIDHSGGLAPVVFAAFMQGRRRPLTVCGPSGRAQHPGCRRFCELLFGVEGAWSYMNTFDGFGIEAVEVPYDAASPVVVPATSGGRSDVEIRSVGVAHGMMPAVAYRVGYGDHSIVFSGDLEGRSEHLVELARGCDLLVHDQSLPSRELEHGHLHPPPEETGANAASAGARRLLLSHLMPEAEEHLDEVLRRVATAFDGPLEVASDLSTFVVA